MYDEDSLFYQIQRAQDNLVPYRVMYERAEKILEAHSAVMVTLDESTVEWVWRKELARRAHERSIIWRRLSEGITSSS